MTERYNQKTTTDIWFEKYLSQVGINYKYEPYGQNNGKSPDFLLSSNEVKILVECKEIEKTIFDNLHGAGSIDIQGHWNLLRDRIDNASKQLKPYSDEVTHTVIILGKINGSSISSNDLYYAMFGNPVIRVPIRIKPEDPIGEAKFDLKVMGALRKNNPQNKEMYFPHNYISAVGIIEEFGALNYHQKCFYDKVFKRFYDKNKPLKSQLSTVMELAEKSWKNHKVPNMYKDPNKCLYRLRLIINPLAKNPLPKNLFNGRWDEVRLPQALPYP